MPVRQAAWPMGAGVIFSGRTPAVQDSVLRLKEKADFTNEMGVRIGRRTGQKQRASMPMLLKTAIHGGFSLGVYHFISKMAAFS